MAGREEKAANLILGVSAALSLGAFPFSHTFWGGLLFHTAIAAAVGGMADWYAVNSLFRKPLGIGRGGLIPEKRDAIIAMARDMMTKEILTVPRLYRVVKTHSISGAFAVWLAQHETEAETGLSELVRAILGAVPGKPLGNLTGEALSAVIQKENWADRLLQVLSFLHQEEKEKILFQGIREGALLFLREGFKEEDFLEIYRRSWTIYEGKGLFRSLFHSVVQGKMGLTDEKAAQMIKGKLESLAESADDPESELNRRICAALNRFEERLRQDEAFREKVSHWIGTRAAALIRENGGAWAELFLSRNASPIGCAAGHWIFQTTLKALAKEENRRRVDRWILKRLAGALPDLHQQIGQYIETTLGRYSGQEMADLLEEGVHADLQMIRINGSAIGALLGLVSYLLFWVVSGGQVL